MIRNRFKHIALALVQVLLVSCNYIHDDIAPCTHYLHFTYTHNMKFADAFAHEMKNQPVAKQVHLYIYDRDGKFIFQRAIGGSELETNRIQLDLQPGTYRLLAWAGLNEGDYTWPTPAKGDPMADWQTAIKGDTSVKRELSGLFHGQMELVIPADSESDTGFPLVKNTNKLRIVLIDANTGTSPIDADAFRIEAVTRNGDLDADNQPVTDQSYTWLPYYQGTEQVNSSNGTAVYTATCYELNTLRLLAGTPTSLRLWHKEEAEPFLDVDLTEFLLLTQMESHNLSAQEYLDRQDEYSILVYLDLTGGKAHYLEILVNDWVIRLDDIHFGKKEA